MSTLFRNLKKAIHLGDVKEVKKLLKLSGKKPLSKNPLIFGGNGLLKLAIGLRKKEIAKLLIKKGARINKKHRVGLASPLHIAAFQKYSDIFALLVKKGATVNDIGHQNLTPLMATMFHSKFEKHFSTLKITKCLLNNGADTEVVYRDPYWNGATALNIACYYSSLKHVKLLLKFNANVNSKSFRNSNPIVTPIMCNSVKLITLLLSYGAQANSLISEEFIETLMVKNIPITGRIKSFGNPTLLHAAIVEQNMKIVELLINYGADINYRTKSYQRTPLLLAIEEYYPEMVELLLKKGAKVDVYDEEGMSPLHYIICNPNNLNERFNLEMLEERENEKIEILEHLIRSGANVNEALEPLGTKLTFLTTAASYGQVGILNYLVHWDHLDVSLIDYNILKSAKLNIDLLSQEQIDNDEFMTSMKTIYLNTEYILITAIVKRYFRKLPVKDELLSTICRHPVNHFWDYDDYIYNLCDLEQKLKKCVESMEKDKIGDSNITMWHLLSSPWGQLINHAYNNHVRELDIDDYPNKYKPFFHILRKRINAAVKRSKLLEQSKEIIFNLFETLPFVCCEEILTYLSDDDLEIINN